MISIIYAGNQSGTCYGIFKLLTQKLENKEKYIFNLQLIKEDILILEKGYKHELTDKQNKLVKSRLLCKMLYNVFTISTYQN